MQFVDADAIDPIYFERPYYVLPSGDGEVGTEAYGVLRDALKNTKKARSDRSRYLPRQARLRAAAEPAGTRRRGGKGRHYLIQKHDATRLHYDFRLEHDGVLKLGRAQGTEPRSRRQAAGGRTEDHPLDYGDFEGTIPKGEYGGGTVMLWDRGTWEPMAEPTGGLRRTAS